MRYKGEIRTQNNSFAKIEVEAKDSRQAKALMAQQYNVRQQEIINFYPKPEKKS
jgi:hypothetical protein